MVRFLIVETAYYPHLNEKISSHVSTVHRANQVFMLEYVLCYEFGTFTVFLFKVWFNELARSLTGSASAQLTQTQTYEPSFPSRLLTHCLFIFISGMDTYISLFPLANELLVNYIGPESRSCMRDPAAFAHISFFTWSSGGFGPAASRNFRLHVRWLWIHCIIFYIMVTFALLDPMITLQGHGWYWFLIETFSFYFISRRRKKCRNPFVIVFLLWSYVLNTLFPSAAWHVFKTQYPQTIFLV